MASVKLRDVNKIYPNGLHALHDINLDIEEGEFMVVVGPSGCAKSTMLRMIAGLENISSGELTIADKICNDVQPKDRGIAMVFQNYALYPHMTVYENMAFGLKVAKKTKAEIALRVHEAAELLEITELLQSDTDVGRGLFSAYVTADLVERTQAGAGLRHSKRPYFYSKSLCHQEWYSNGLLFCHRG
jgi:ABC-type sugar transport system ATPase subunit